MAWYSMFKTVERGQGDYGTNKVCIFDGPSKSEAMVIAWAMGYSQGYGYIPVEIFKGKRLGKHFKTVHVNPIR